MSGSFPVSIRRDSVTDRALSGQRGAGSYQVTPAEQRAGGDRSGQGHETRDCVGQPPAQRSPLIVTENGSYAVVRLSSYTLEYEADGLGKTWFEVRDAATIRHLRDDVDGLKA